MAGVNPPIKQLTDDPPLNKDDLLASLRRLALLRDVGVANQETLLWILRQGNLNLNVVPTEPLISVFQTLTRLACRDQKSSSATCSRKDIVANGGGLMALQAMFLHENDQGVHTAACMFLSFLSLDHRLATYLTNIGVAQALTISAYSFLHQPVLTHYLAISRAATALAGVTSLARKVERTGIMGPLMTATGKLEGEVGLAVSVCQLLWQLSIVPESVPYMVQKGVIGHVLNAIYRNKTCPELVAAACGVIMHLATVHPNARVLVEQKGVRRVVDVIHVFSGRPDILQAALPALTVLCRHSSICRLRVLGIALGEVLHVLGQHTGDPDTSLLVMGLFMCLTDLAPIVPPDETAQERTAREEAIKESSALLEARWAGEQDGLTLLLQCLEKGPDNKRLVHQCVQILLNLAANPKNRTQLALKALEPVLSVAERHSDDLAVLSTVNNLLAELADDRDNLKRIAQLGAVPLVLHTMQTASDNARLLATACNFMRVVGVQQQHRLTILQRGGIDMVFSAINNFPGELELVKNAIDVLGAVAREAEAKVALVDKGVIPLLAKARERFPQAKGLHRSISRVVRSLMVDEGTEQSADVGAIGPLIGSDSDEDDEGGGETGAAP